MRCNDRQRDARGRRRRLSHLVIDDRGANAVEYLLVVGVVALGALVGVRAFGGTLDAKIRCFASALERDTACSNGGARSAVESADDIAEGEAVDFGPRPPTGPSSKRMKVLPIRGRPFQKAGADSIAIQPNDISQGELGDCYLLAALGAISARAPSAIARLVSSDENGDGTYTVTFRKPTPDPWWKLWGDGTAAEAIRVTPTFPTRNGRPVFAQPSDSTATGWETWPMLVEKAYAKRGRDGKNGYEAIVGGNAGVAMQDITGRASSFWNPADTDLATVYELWRRGDAMTASSLPAKDARRNPLYRGTTTRRPTLVSSHAYFITGVDAKAGTITLQNPWGWQDGGIELTWDEFQASFCEIQSNPIRRPAS